MAKTEITFTPEEKIKLVMGKNSWATETFDGKLPSVRVSDGPVGVRGLIDPEDSTKGDNKTIAYPSIQLLSHTWDASLAKKYGEAIGNDCIDCGIDIILGPAVNIKRLPTCGRNFEYFSEDPILAGLMAEAYIAGVQSVDIGTSLKHYCCNNLEYARMFASSEVDERTLREIYLKQFEIATRAKPWTVMCSYNLLNGTLMAENKKMFSLLRTEFGFDGLIMSDWSAVREPYKSINAGLDLIMPHRDAQEAALKESLEKGEVESDMLDVTSGRVVALAEKCEKARAVRKNTMTLDERNALALSVAEQGIVLLKNDGILPLHGEKIMVTGAPERVYYCGGGSAHVTPSWDYKRLGEAMTDEGYDSVYRETVRDPIAGHACMNGSCISCRDEMAHRDVAIIEVGDSCTTETESRDRSTIRLCREERDAIHYLTSFCDKVIVVVYAGSAVDMSDWIDEVSAVVWAGYGGKFANKAVANVLTGKVNPTGKLTETFPVHVEDLPAASGLVNPEKVVYEEGLMVGYRWSETKKAKVLFPFGYGLSYSSYSYSDLTVSRDEKGLSATFSVTNTSDVAGAEIAQLYIGRFSKEPGRPKRELKGFGKAVLAPHETKRLTVTVPETELRFFSLKTNRWEKIGKATVEIGKNCRDIVLTAKIESV